MVSETAHIEPSPPHPPLYPNGQSVFERVVIVMPAPAAVSLVRKAMSVEASDQSHCAGADAEPRSVADVASSSTVSHWPRPFIPPRLVGWSSKRTVSFVPAGSKNASTCRMHARKGR